MNRYLRAAAAVAWLAVAVLAGCGGSSDGDSAQLRLLNASTGYTSLDLYVDDEKKNSAIAYGATGGYVDVSTDSITTALKSAGGSTTLSSASRTLSGDTHYAIVAYGWSGALKTALIEENVESPASGKTKLMVLNTATDAGSVDVYLTGSDESLEDATAVASSVSGGSTAGYNKVSSGSYRLRVTGAGDKTDLRLDIDGLTLSSAKVQTLIITPGSGGVLVSALLYTQQGSVTSLTNTQARVRVVGSVSSNGLVSAYMSGTTLLSSSSSPTIGSYYTLTAGSLTPTVVVNGSTLSTSAQTFSAGGDYTLLVWGDAASPQVALITDDNRLPTSSSYAKFRLVHAVANYSNTLTLQIDYSAVASNIAAGAASSYTSVAAESGTARYDVTASGGTTLYSLTDATITAKGVYTMFALGDSTTPVFSLRKER